MLESLRCLIDEGGVFIQDTIGVGIKDDGYILYI